MEIINSKERKEIIAQLNEQFGINKIPYTIIRFGKDKIRIYSGEISNEELLRLDQNLRIETAGLYFAKQQEDGIRLTLDGIAIFKDQIKKGILELSDEQAKEWLKGNELLIQTERGFRILKNQGEFIGCGKATGEKIANFMPKERRVRN
jgi:NOL1/NOP2/fmu family ribosome biogenesis protein